VTRSAIVNEHEGAVLGVIARRQPVTRYQVLRAFQRSPVRMYNSSKGSLYPLIARMVDRQLVVVNGQPTRRETETLSLSESGYDALRLWVQGLRLDQTLIQDPLLVRATSLGEIDRDARIRWIAEAKQLILDKKHELAGYVQAVRLPYGDIVFAAADAELDVKLRWLDRLLIKVVDEAEAERTAAYDWD